MTATTRTTTSKFMQKTGGSCRNWHENLRSERESAGREAHPFRPVENEGSDQGVTR
jgi:hypothetical protein